LLALVIGTAVWASGCVDDSSETLDPEIGSVVVTQSNGPTELFLEYPHPVAGIATGNWAIHLTDMEDFQPVRSGNLVVRFSSSSGTTETFEIESPARDGIFLLDPIVSLPGKYRIELELASPQVSSRHVLDEVVVYPALAEALAVRQPEDGGGIVFLKEQQWVIPFAVQAAAAGVVERTVTAPGEVVPPDGALVQVSALVDGIAPAEGNRNAPSVGEVVRQGQVLVVLAPTTQEGGFARARGRLERLEREVERAERLLEAGAIPSRRLVEARHDSEIARAEVDAMGGMTDGDYRLSLRAPISGVIAARSFVPGGRVQPGEPLFTIVDPTKAWLRVQVSPGTAASIPEGARATFTLEDSNQAFGTSRLLSIGSIIDPQTRTVPVVFETEASGAALTFGQLAQAAIPTGGTVTGIVLPNSAILDDNGTTVAYVQAGGETFERRVLTLGTRDGVQAQVLAGIVLGEMVVTIGAYQVRLASLSGGDFAGAHAH